MEQRPIVEVFERDNKGYDLVVQPATAVRGVRAFLEAQKDEVQIRNAVMGDVAVRLINGTSLEQNLPPDTLISGWHEKP